ncbi:MAG: Rpp14/Pop5 family protein [Methanomicrobiaceae archaeon]|nr:Rpp14/Pop5 family protein [Methanomicrobiaceae archaeon]
MTVRPPTLRVRYRYILASVSPPYREIEPKKMHRAIHEAVTSLHGDAQAAVITMGVMGVGGGSAILRCQRGCEHLLRLALSTVTAVDGVTVSLSPVAVSGTMKALRKKIPASPAFHYEGEREIGGRLYAEWLAEDGKIDFIAKGIRTEETLYIIHDEMEDMSYATAISDGI